MRALPTAIFGLMSLLLLLCLGSVETLQGVATLLPSDLDASPTTASPAFVHAAALRALASPSGALKVLVFNDMPCGSDFFGAWFKPPLRMDCGTELEFYRWDFRRNISAMDAVLISVGQATLLAPTLDLGAPHGVSNAAPSPTLKRRGQRWFSCSKENGKSFFTTSDSELRSVYGIDYILNYKLSSVSSCPTNSIANVVDTEQPCSSLVSGPASDFLIPLLRGRFYENFTAGEATVQHDKEASCHASQV